MTPDRNIIARATTLGWKSENKGDETDSGDALDWLCERVNESNNAPPDSYVGMCEGRIETLEGESKEWEEKFYRNRDASEKLIARMQETIEASRDTQTPCPPTPKGEDTETK